MLFALEVEDLKKDKSSTRLLLNPAEFVIPPKSDYRIDAFVMAKNKAQSDLTFTKSNNDSIIGEFSLYSMYVCMHCLAVL